MCCVLAHNTHAAPGSPEALKQAQDGSAKGQAEAHPCPAAVGNEGLASLQALKAQAISAQPA